MSALEKRALCFYSKGQIQVDQDEVLFDEAIDENGTVLTAGLTDSDESDNESARGITIIAVIAPTLENEEIQGVSDD